MSLEFDKKLFDIFDTCQDSTASHDILLGKCQKLYKEVEFPVFFEGFTGLMRHAMISMQKNPHIDRLVDFIAKFASDPTNQNPNTTVVETRETRNSARKEKKDDNDTNNTTVKENNDTAISNTQDQTQATLNSMDEEEFENIFLTSLIDFLIESSKANSDAVRYRCCHMLSKLMSAISNEQFIDEDLYDRLSDALLERLKDINSKVQVQAIAAIYRLQDPNDRDCRISRVFLFLMTYDPSWMVRYQALSHVAFSKMTLPEIIDRVRDPNANVRKKALLILSEKVLIKFISIEKRLFILNHSLKDEDTGVLDTCCKRLLPSWLAFKENDLVKLLKALDVVEATETMEIMMDKMYAEHSMTTICDDFIGLLNERHVIPLDKLNAESVFYWSWVCAQCKGKSSQTKENLTNESKIESDESLDRLLPSLTEYCEYTQQVLAKINNEHNELEVVDERIQIENLYIIKQIIKMFEYIEFSDVYGKKTLTNLCHNLFSNKNYIFLYDSVMSVYKLLIPNLQTRINNLVELISDIQDPTCQKIASDEDKNEEMVCSESVPNENNLNEASGMEVVANSNEPINQTLGLSKLTPRELQLKISELKYKRFQLKDAFDNLYKEIKNVDKMVDLNQVSELRIQIKECEEEINLLEAYLRGDVQQNKDKTISKELTLESEPVIAEPDEQTIVDPIECTHHCLHIAICLLKDTSLVSITPQLRSLFDTLIISNIGSVNEEIRINSVKAMSLICILKLEMAQKYVPLMLEMIQHDMKEVVISAFQAMINFILAFSLNRLANLDASNTSTNPALNATTPEVSDPQQTTERTAKILAVMTSLLDSEDQAIYTTAVEGFCKLYMTGHIVSAKLLSKLIIMYYSPITENDVKLRACLSTFLPQFSFFRPCNQICVEETFMPIMKSLVNAPPDSYLSEIDLMKVMESMFNLTNPKNLIQRRTQNRVIQHNNICHENIVRSICYEILKDDNAFKCKSYLKIMQMADLNNADYLALKSIHELTDEVHLHISDKLVKKTAVKFNDLVYGLMIKKPEYEEEQKKLLEEQKKSDEALETQINIVDETNSTLLNTDENNATRMNSTRLSTSGDMIDLDFKKIGIKAGNKKNRTLCITKITEANEPGTQDETRNEQNGTVVQNSKRRSSPIKHSPSKINDDNLNSSQELNTSSRSSTDDPNEKSEESPQRSRRSTRTQNINSSVCEKDSKKLKKKDSYLTGILSNNSEIKLLDVSVRLQKMDETILTGGNSLRVDLSNSFQTRSRSLNKEKNPDKSSDEVSPVKAAKKRNKRSLTEDNNKTGNEETLARSNRSKSNRTKTQDYEPPAKVSRETRSSSSKNSRNDAKKKPETLPTRLSTRSSSTR